MNKITTNYLILGANASGLSAAVRILKSDKQAKITVLEKSDVVSFGSCGIPYYVAGEFDDINQMTARPLEDFIKLGIDVRLFHTAIGLDPLNKQVTAHNGNTNQSVSLAYDKLFIAVGASPTTPPIKGLAAKNIHTMHSKADAITILNLLPEIQHVVIIGAGFIGMEAAEAFSEQGKNVTVIEFAERVLARTFDAEITPQVEDALQRHSVALQLNESVLEIKHENGAAHSVLTNKDEYPADLVIVATGFKPNTEFLRNTDIKLSKEGAIIIDDQCKTNLPDIYAAGDCATVPHKISGNVYIPLATSANKLGRIAGDVMAGKDSRFIGTLGSSGVRVFDVEAGRTGITEEEAKQLGIDYGTVVIKDKNQTDYVPGQSDMWVKLIYEQQSRKLLGGQVCGRYLGGAVHRVDALAVAVYSGLTVEELGFMDFIYAPPFARTWEILNIAGNVAK
ncbi:putative NAD(FAD)-dependent dehydrogenase [Solimicrobium silvestre]|uniref:Putative NAD(FAD)-dependent dehydrogenase n=2 Tax=Solimicrobium silvestre TaxID=2099400 RepID=A0A2S9GXG4_9BURK|nr:putative NAD(FAD)-dependent dehydrogenase [Solimicrobium silvestre]